MRRGARVRPRALLGLGALAAVACTQLRPPGTTPGTSAVTLAALSPSPPAASREPEVPAASPQPLAPSPAPVSPVPPAVPGVSLPAGPAGVFLPAPSQTPIQPSPRVTPVPTGPPSVPVGAPATVVARIGALPDTTRLARLIGLAGLEATLGGPGPYTVFAPTDVAFARLALGDLAALERPENRPLLAGILTHHVVAGALPRSSLVDSRLTSLARLSLPVTTVAEAPRVAGAGIVQADLAAGNGVVHTIDAVLMPPDLTPTATTVVEVVEQRAELSILEQALAASGLVPTLRGTGPFTLFAPTDAAFDALPTGAVARLLQPDNQPALAALLRYHLVRGSYGSGKLVPGGLPSDLTGPQNGTVSPYAIPLTLDGGALRVGGHPIRLPDTFSFNGVVHVIDGVLVPPGFVLP